MKTMEQDWEDTFPFLMGTSYRGVRDNQDEPYLLALCHARSQRHLELMLREWLPPHWRLSNDELVAMQMHWSTYYEPHRLKGGTSDHLARSAIERMTRNSYGLRTHYMRKIKAAFKGDTELWYGIDSSSSTPFYRHDDPCVDRPIFGSIMLDDAHRCGFTVRLQQSDVGAVAVWASIHIHVKGITEALTQRVITMHPPTFAHGILVEDREAILCYRLDTEAVGKAAGYGNACRRGVTMFSAEEAERFKAEVVRQFHALGILIVLSSP